MTRLYVPTIKGVMRKRSKCACKIGVLTEYSCCDGPPDLSILDRLGPPPKPPWLRSTQYDTTCNNTQYYNPSGVTHASGPGAEANSSAGTTLSLRSPSISFTGSPGVSRSDVLQGSTFSGDISTVLKSGDPVPDQSNSPQTSPLPDESNTSPLLIDIYGSTAFSGATRDPPHKISVTSPSIVSHSSGRETESGSGTTTSDGAAQRSHTSAIGERDPLVIEKDLTTHTQWTSSAASLPPSNTLRNSSRHAIPSKSDNKVPYSKVTTQYHKDEPSTATIITYQANALGHSDTVRPDDVTTSLSFRSTVFSLLSPTRLSHSTASDFAFTHADTSDSWRTEASTSEQALIETYTAPPTTISPFSSAKPSTRAKEGSHSVSHQPKVSTVRTTSSKIRPTPWGFPRTTTEALWEDTATFNTSGPGNRSSSTNGRNISSAETVLISLSLVIACAVIAALVAYYFYKKRYQFKVKPEEAEEDNNFLYNYRMLGRRWEPEGSPERPPVEEETTRRKPPRTARSPRRQPSTDDKAALIAGTPTSQMSLSSSGGDSGEAPPAPAPALPHHPNFTPYVRRDDLDPTGTLLSPKGGHGDVISYSDLLPSPGVRDSTAAQNGRTKPRGQKDSVGPGDLNNSQETSFRGPLPILTPLGSSHDPVFRARGGFEGVTPSNNCDSSLASLKRPNTLEPLYKDHSENRKRHRKRRKPHSQYNHVAMETISHDAAEIVPIKNGESNA